MNLQLTKHLLRALLALFFVFIVKLAEAGTVTVTIGYDAVNNKVFAGWTGSLNGPPPGLSDGVYLNLSNRFDNSPSVTSLWATASTGDRCK